MKPMTYSGDVTMTLTIGRPRKTGFGEVEHPVTVEVGMFRQRPGLAIVHRDGPVTERFQVFQKGARVANVPTWDEAVDACIHIVTRGHGCLGIDWNDDNATAEDDEDE